MCDTFVALPEATPDNVVIFGKNSDREPNEAQAAEYYPPEFHSGKTSRPRKCTYLRIPDVNETKGVLICRPFWMWGAEMGINTAGVAIGNEAVFTRMPYAVKGGLTGMDLLRLALERAGSAEEGLETIVRLIADHGQGGACGYEDKKFIYHNSFIIADPREAWVLETAGHLWAALKVKSTYAISNGLTIGEAFDRQHPDLIETARRKRWLKKGGTFHFADSFSAPVFTAFSGSGKRRSTANAAFAAHPGSWTLPNAFKLLRHHGPEPYRPDRHFLTNRICAHAGNRLTRNSGTTGAMVAHITPRNPTIWITGTAATCTGVFKPVRLEEPVIPDIGPAPGAVYDPNTLWWRHEMFHRCLLRDLETFSASFHKERDDLENTFLAAADTAPDESFPALSRTCFDQATDLTEKWLKKTQARLPRRPLKRGFRRYWNKQNEKAGIAIQY